MMSHYKGKYMDDGVQVRCFSLRSNKLLTHKRLQLLLNRLTPDGKRVPVRLRFVTSRGELVEWKNVVCTSRNARKRTHTFVSLESHNYRTVKDVLILMVDDVKITVD